MKIRKLAKNIIPQANKGAFIQGDKYRFTVLTTRLIRLEYSESGIFENRATQTVINRNFPVPEYRVIDTEDNLEIITEHVRLRYNKKKFSSQGLTIELRGNYSPYHSTWRYDTPFETLKGTACTLDEADGAIPLEEGLISRNGFSMIDDSKSILLEENGWVSPRPKDAIDLYYLGYGRKYLECLRDFYKLCGQAPLIPRFTLGNWWSRFYQYTDDEYKELMTTFKKHDIPLSVSVIDMDWHLTEIDSRYGSGWTGYTWNHELFKDPAKLMSWLHGQGLHVTLNVHPADGVRAHEEAYPEMAKALGVNAENEDKIDFDVSSPEFLDAYFKYLHHPNEESGVDFWWLDWQQKGGSRIEGIDPLWMLNHYHYLDNARNGKRPLTFSRYAGLGSHRYPIGFSGDSFATWASLDFQPYFTAAASNSGYGWWSHDIGGHMHGKKDNEIALRWVQFGVFSPIMRLHSSKNPFFQKEPWTYDLVSEKILKKFMRLRHQLVPYIYTMNERFHRLGEPLVRPMYYPYPDNENAYNVPNQYMFGTQLIVCPITSPTLKQLTMAAFNAWIPEGFYYDIFLGRVYRGGRRLELFRGISMIPVLAPAGAIIPLCADQEVQNSTANPKALEILIFNGADGTFSLYEDNDLDDEQNRSCITEMSLERNSFTIKAAAGDSSIIQIQRKYILHFYGLSDVTQIQVNGDDFPASSYDAKKNILTLEIEDVPSNTDLCIMIQSSSEIHKNDVVSECFDLLNNAQIEFDLKAFLFDKINQQPNGLILVSELQSMHLDAALTRALTEIITAF